MAIKTQGTVDQPYSRLGKFDFGFDAPVFGELTVAEEDSQLSLQDELCQIEGPSKSHVTGVLHDGTKVTLIRLVSNEQSTRMTEGGLRHRFVRMFPHFILEGLVHLDPLEENIHQISFGLEHGSALFYDIDAFGSVDDGKPIMDLIASTHKSTRKIEIGEYPSVVYFNGKVKILETDTALGRMSVGHNPSWSVGGPEGISIKDFITVRLDFTAPIKFDEAINRLVRLLRFLELVIGRPQGLLRLTLKLHHPTDDVRLNIHWCHGPGRSSYKHVDSQGPQPGDILLDAIRRPEEFVEVARNWLESDFERRDARQRFDAVFAEQRTFDEDRIISAANMFDLLPASAVPSSVPLTDDIAQAKRIAKKAFRNLPLSIERDSMLSALGRLGDATLKHKVKHRAELILSKVPPTRFPKLTTVLEAAVDCRNHYVHGSRSVINYRLNFDLVVFLTSTLEFVFGAAELIEAGWDINAFIAKGSSMTHPYGSYLVSYKRGLAFFELIIPPRL